MLAILPSATFEARFDGFPTGLTGTARWRLDDNNGTVTAWATSAITESPTGEGTYIVRAAGPATVGQYSVVFNTGTSGPSNTATEDLLVSTVALTTAVDQGAVVAPGGTFEARFDSFPTGLTGTARWRLDDNAGVQTSWSTSSITESPAGEGSYVVRGTAPTAAGLWAVVFNDGTDGPSHTASEELVVFGAFNYDTTLVTTLDQVRFLISDTDPDAPLFVDSEIAFYLAARGDAVNTAAADLADVLALRFARAFDFSADGQSFSRSQMSRRYSDLAKALRAGVTGITTVVPTRVDGYSQDIAADEVGTTSARPRQRYAGGSDFDVP